MVFLDSFSQQSNQDDLQNSLCHSDKSENTFSLEKCENNKKFKLLTMRNGEIEEKYVLAKIPENLDFENQEKLTSSGVIYPLLISDYDQNETYGAFKNQEVFKHFLLPQENNIECLKIILNNLAEHQALCLNTRQEVNTPCEYNLKDIADPVTKLDFFKGLGLQEISNSIRDFELLLKEVLNSDLCVKSIGCHFVKNVYVNQNINQTIFIKVSSGKPVSPVYDALLYIFALSNEKFRQAHFEELILHYFNSLRRFLQDLKSNLADRITKSYSEHKVRVLLPVIKFEIASSLLSLGESVPEELLRNILYFLKYPLINQEDIYEGTKNKLRSSHFDLVHYNLKSLSETNGHLGEYYHLDIKIKVQEKYQDLQLFAKIMKPPNDFGREVMQSGPAKKEDFFYNRLIPLFIEHGLESLLDFAPWCYLSRENFLLILDDLSREGYVSHTPNVTLSYDGLRTIVENMAKLHACTLILEEILSKKLGKTIRLDEDYEEFFKECVLVNDESNLSFKKLWDESMKTLYHVVDKFPEVTKNLKLSQKKLRERLKKLFLSIFSKVKKSNTIRNVINHGDMYIGNMLLKYGEDKLITKAKLVDFQMLRYVPPSFELLFFLFENSTKQTRDKHFKKLLEDYYQYLSENLRKFDLDPETVFPKTAFEEDVNEMTPVAIIVAYMYAHAVQINPELREEIVHDQEKFKYYFEDHKNELIDLCWSDDHYRNVLKGLVEDLVKIVEK